jgi:hypothetical protein
LREDEVKGWGDDGGNHYNVGNRDAADLFVVEDRVWKGYRFKECTHGLLLLFPVDNEVHDLESILFRRWGLRREGRVLKRFL